MGVDSLNLSDKEQRLLEKIHSEESIPQSKVWKELEMSSKTVSRIARKLEDKDLISREETTYDGSRTYSLELTRESENLFREDIDFSLLMSGKMISPFIDEDNVEVVDDNQFDQWIMNLVEDEQP